MTLIRFFIFPLCFIAIAACEKDKLDGEMSILTGTWNWTETYGVYNYCDTDSLWKCKLPQIQQRQSSHLKSNKAFATLRSPRWSNALLSDGQLITPCTVLFLSHIVVDS
ncbi:MAG: hypothetical protein J7L96_06795 [Bacteroidales bacterium]|nr:hypothetical protein [Bacteroidales bacterium]